MHSPEPWKAQHYEPRYDYSQPSYASHLFDAYGVPLTSLFDQRPNNDRIVACVNFLQEIPTEALLKILGDKQIHYNILELTKFSVTEALAHLEQRKASNEPLT